MAKFELVVGANYGDEGKGTVTARIAEKNKRGKILNVLTNGGSQRGHSVLFDGKTHVFKHFGSGTSFGAVSCFSNDFILNPIQFCKELEEIRIAFGKRPESMRMENCKWSTPYDMMFNQMESIMNWKGTCGMGIWATLCRYADMPATPTFSSFSLASDDSKIEFLNSVKRYYENKIDVSKFPEYEKPWNSEELQWHFIADCKSMFVETDLFDGFGRFDIVIFENGQGLLLGDEGLNDPEKTPSVTGSKTIEGFNIPDEAEVTLHYVTRPYLTRHGSKTFVEEHVDGDMKPELEINVFNEWQRDFKQANLGALGRFDLKRRIEKDCAWTFGKKNWNYCMDVTHCDEIDDSESFLFDFAPGLGDAGKPVVFTFHDNPEVSIQNCSVNMKIV